MLIRLALSITFVSLVPLTLLTAWLSRAAQATPVTVKAQVQPAKDELALNLLGKLLGPLDDHIGQGESKANEEKQNETNSAIDKKPMSLRGILAAWCAHCKKAPPSLCIHQFLSGKGAVGCDSNSSKPIRPCKAARTHDGSFGTWVPRQAIYFASNRSAYPSFDANLRWGGHVGKLLLGQIHVNPPVLMTIGQGHAGTTTVADWLVDLPFSPPEGFLPAQPLRFIFSYGYRHANMSDKEAGLFNSLIPKEKLEASYLMYAQSFNGTGLIDNHLGIDITPGYGGTPEGCFNGITGQIIATRIHTALPNMKFIVLVRDIADLLYSVSYCQTPGLFDKMARQMYRNGKFHLDSRILNFITTTKRFMSMFGADRFLFILSSRMKCRSIEVLLDISEFLGICPDNSLDLVRIARTKAHVTGTEKAPMYEKTRAFINKYTCHISMEMAQFLHSEEDLGSCSPELFNYSQHRGKLAASQCGRASCKISGLLIDSKKAAAINSKEMKEGRLPSNLAADARMPSLTDLYELQNIGRPGVRYVAGIRDEVAHFAFRNNCTISHQVAVILAEHYPGAFPVTELFAAHTPGLVYDLASWTGADRASFVLKDEHHAATVPLRAWVGCGGRYGEGVAFVAFDAAPVAHESGCSGGAVVAHVFPPCP